MGGYLIFHPNKKVEILRMYGYFNEIGDTSSLYLNQYDDNYRLNKRLDSIQGTYGSKVWISDVIDEEKDANLKNSSKVKAIYPK
ncbi:hypothetical protein [Fulvivirga sediminis]|uniref:Uncharacterized protein n=1 Tax=Fulvivirga sediminis TaxID=2803949 RepID=A0A937FAP4_9BACT|nr:hypothetical protein [Fulvivirga sediminis]MBL3657118.1 hypothetical protein [Fulvivirga sediminis]